MNSNSYSKHTAINITKIIKIGLHFEIPDCFFGSYYVKFYQKYTKYLPFLFHSALLRYTVQLKCKAE